MENKIDLILEHILLQKRVKDLEFRCAGAFYEYFETNSKRYENWQVEKHKLKLEIDKNNYDKLVIECNKVNEELSELLTKIHNKLKNEN